MPSCIKKEDLRIIKTEKALNLAMFTLLERNSFGKITVRDICQEALISRAAFYAHYSDKYDLLKYWLIHFVLNNISIKDTYEQTEESINKFVHKNEKIIRNLIYDADSETLELLFEAVLSVLNFNAENNNYKKTDPKYIVFSNFCAGGMLYYLSWQVKNNFPPEVALMNIYLYELINKFREFSQII